MLTVCLAADLQMNCFCLRNLRTEMIEYYKNCVKCPCMPAPSPPNFAKTFIILKKNI